MRILLFGLMAALLGACTNNTRIPPDIIPSHKMETVLWQLMQSDEYVNKRFIKDSLTKSRSEKMKIYQQVFDLNGISMDEFKKSYSFYMSHPDITKVIFDSIAAKAGRQRSVIYNPKPVLPQKPFRKV